MRRVEKSYNNVDLIPLERIEQKIFLIRGQKVMIDNDLAKLYGVSTKRLNEQVKRNLKRFPLDFMFQLTKNEFVALQTIAAKLRSQFATSKSGGRRYYPYVFTEQGVAMLSSVLNSERAILVNIAIMRTFVKLRHILTNHEEFADKLNEHERKIERHEEKIIVIFETMHKLMREEEKPKAKFGFI